MVPGTAAHSDRRSITGDSLPPVTQELRQRTLAGELLDYLYPPGATVLPADNVSMRCSEWNLDMVLKELDYDQVPAYMESSCPRGQQELAAIRRHGGINSQSSALCGQACYRSTADQARRLFVDRIGFRGLISRAVRELRQLDADAAGESTTWSGTRLCAAGGAVSALGYDGIVRYHLGEAVGELRKSNGSFVLVFNDIDKHGYPARCLSSQKSCAPGGVLIMDNICFGTAASFSPMTAQTRWVSTQG